MENPVTCEHQGDKASAVVNFNFKDNPPVLWIETICVKCGAGLSFDSKIKWTVDINDYISGLTNNNGHIA